MQPLPINPLKTGPRLWKSTTILLVASPRSTWRRLIDDSRWYSARSAVFQQEIELRYPVAAKFAGLECEVRADSRDLVRERRCDQSELVLSLFVQLIRNRFCIDVSAGKTIRPTPKSISRVAATASSTEPTGLISTAIPIALVSERFCIFENNLTRCDKSPWSASSRASMYLSYRPG